MLCKQTFKYLINEKVYSLERSLLCIVSSGKKLNYKMNYKSQILENLVRSKVYLYVFGERMEPKIVMFCKI